MKKYNNFLIENLTMSKTEILEVYDDLNKGDIVSVTYDSVINGLTTTKLKVSKGKTKIGKSKIERITLVNPDNLKGVKYYLYNRSFITLAIGDMAASLKAIEKI